MAIALCLIAAIQIVPALQLISRYQREQWIVRKIVAAGGRVQFVDIGSAWADRDFLPIGPIFDRIQTVTLSECDMTPDLISTLASADHLSWLKLDFTRIGDAELKLLPRLRQLKILDLDQSSICDSNVEELVKLMSLEQLFLCGTEITDLSLPRLKEMTHLKSLWVKQTRTTYHGRAELRKALPDCTIVDDWERPVD